MGVTDKEIVIASLKGLAATGVIPLFSASLALHWKRTGQPIAGWAVQLLVDLFYLLLIFMMLPNFLNPNVTVFPEGKVAYAGLVLWPAVCTCCLAGRFWKNRRVDRSRGLVFAMESRCG